MKLTGIVLTSALRTGRDQRLRHARRGPGTLAAHHQHFFSIRLDMAVDGLTATLSMRWTPKLSRPGPQQPATATRSAHGETAAADGNHRRSALIDPLRGPVLAGGQSGPPDRRLGHEPVGVQARPRRQRPAHSATPNARR